MSTTTVGIAQWHPVCGEPRRNLVTALTLIKSLVAQGCTLIVLPELWASGYDAASLADDTAVAAEPLDGERGRQLSAAALQHRVWLFAGSVPAIYQDGRLFNTAVITAFATIAVLLAALGIYSIITFSVASRAQEMAIRIALGSQRSGIMRLILVSGAKLTVIGCGIGLLGAIAASSLLRSLLFDVSPFDPLVLTLAACSVLLLTLVASALPARRAAAIDPIHSLRAD